MHFNLSTDRFASGLGLIGVGAFAIAPAWVSPLLGWGFIGAGAMVLLSGARFQNGHLTGIGAQNFWARSRAVWPQALMFVCAAGFFIGLVAYFQRSHIPAPPTQPALLTRMQTDFPSMDALSSVWAVRLSGSSTNKVNVIIYSDIRTMTKFVAFYVPDLDVFETCKHLAGRLRDILNGPSMMTVNGVPVQSPMIIAKKFEGDPNFQTSENQVFTGAVYIYYEGYLSDEQRVELRKLFKDQGAPSLMFRAAKL